MTLTALDTGVFRFLEFSLTLVFQHIYTEEDLNAATRTLLAEWPALGSRLNLLVCHHLTEFELRRTANWSSSREYIGYLEWKTV